MMRLSLGDKLCGAGFSTAPTQADCFVDLKTIDAARHCRVLSGELPA